MSKLISIWGKGSSGKSTIASNIACLLAKEYTVALISGNKNYASIQHYFGVEIPIEKSFSEVINLTEDDDILKSFVQYTKIKNLFILGLSDRDHCLSVTKFPEAAAKKIFEVARSNFDFVIIDSSENYDDTLTILGLTESQKVIEVIKPTIQGVAFALSYQELFQRLGITKKIVSILNCDKNYLRISDIESKLEKKFSVIIPYYKDIEITENDGSPSVESKKNKKFNRKIEKITNILKDIIVF